MNLKGPPSLDIEENEENYDNKNNIKIEYEVIKEKCQNNEDINSLIRFMHIILPKMNINDDFEILNDSLHFILESVCNDKVTSNIQQILYQYIDYIIDNYKDYFKPELFDLLYFILDGFNECIGVKNNCIDLNRLYDLNTQTNYKSQRNLYKNNGRSIMNFVMTNSVTFWYKYDNYIKNVIVKNYGKLFRSSDKKGTIVEYFNYNYSFDFEKNQFHGLDDENNDVYLDLSSSDPSLKLFSNQRKVSPTLVYFLYYIVIFKR